MVLLERFLWQVLWIHSMCQERPSHAKLCIPAKSLSEIVKVLMTGTAAWHKGKYMCNKQL